MKTKLNARSIKRLQGVHEDLVKVVARAVELTEIPFQITEGVRTLARQKHLKAIGASRTLRSRHLTGHAVDVVAYVGNKISWSFPLYLRISKAFKAAAKELGVFIKWGGDWKSIIDGPHFQLTWKAYPAKGAVRPTSQSVGTLRVGAAGAKVIEMQRRLHAASIRIGVDGSFGPKTHTAILKFQKAHSLKPDGIVGPRTWARLRQYKIS